MISRDNMVIWINLRFYWEMAIKPEKNEAGEYVNYFTLIDSVEKKAIETLAYKSELVIAMLRERNMDVFRKIGEQLKDVAAKHNIYMIEAKDLPKGKKQR